MFSHVSSDGWTEKPSHRGAPLLKRFIEAKERGERDRERRERDREREREREKDR